ncbi:hypothetical protein GOBAR_DD07988 [Gossypium barbadense]|nr:hypothetical protein GOBAR_DD07988 [Gossypium barbadense]
MAKKINVTKKALIPGLIKPSRMSNSRMSKGKLKPEDAVQATLSSLPDEVVDTVGVTALLSEDSVSERRRKLEYLEMQEELIKMTIPTAKEAQEQAIARALEKRDQLYEISCALAVLASASSVSREREEFLGLVNKEDDKEVDETGVEPEDIELVMTQARVSRSKAGRHSRLQIGTLYLL